MARNTWYIERENMIDGLKKYTTKKLNLDRFFDGDESQDKDNPNHWVIIRIWPTVTDLELSALRSQSIEMSSKQSTGENKSKYNISAETLLRINKLMLTDGTGIEDHNFIENGQKRNWDDNLWKELNNIKPEILKYIAKEIDLLNNPIEGTENPT